MSGSSSQAALANPSSALPHIQREPSKEDIELAQQLVNHAQGIQSGQQSITVQQQPDQRESSIIVAASSQQPNSEPQYSHNETDTILRLQNGSELSPVPGRRSLGVNGGGGQMCR